MLENGWIFNANFEGATKDHLFGFELLSQVYQKADPKARVRSASAVQGGLYDAVNWTSTIILKSR